MSDLNLVRVTLLELGLEDWIPVPEAVSTVRACGSRQPEQDVRDVLGALGREGRVRFWRGKWDREDEHVEVSVDEAVDLLADPRWFHFDLDGPAKDRLYFVNVKNIAPASI